MDKDFLSELFLGHLLERARPIHQGGRLAHYTTAESAYLILKNREVWLRNSILMNDYSEMKHGKDCLVSAWGSPGGERLQAFLEENWPEFPSKLANLFDGHLTVMLNATHIISLSEHDDDEDEYGRLSMWRAYGGATGVAIILNTQAFQKETDEMGVFSAPVIYKDINSFILWFETWADKLIESKDKLLQCDEDSLRDIFFHAFRIFVLTTKHPGFAEEKEWRVFHTVNIDRQTSFLRYETEVIHGIPQHIVKLELRDDEELGVKGVCPNLLINRLIIGPSENPFPIKIALSDALVCAEVENHAEKTWLSFIPLRQRQ